MTERALSLSFYTDAAVCDDEAARLFAPGPNYAGHDKLVPEVGDYFVQPWSGGASVLVRSDDGARQLSNVCRHRQAALLRGRGHARAIVCPIHRWTYGLDGELRGAPHFAERPCRSLAGSTLTTWNGLLFAGPRDVAADLAGLSRASQLGFDGFVLEEVAAVEHAFNWKTFMELYLEVYHLDAAHPGFRTLCDAAAVEWELGERFSVQYAPLSSAFARPGSAAHERYHAALVARGGPPEVAAIWFAYYPNVMIECYPFARAVSTVHPRGPGACLNVVELYVDARAAREDREIVDAVKAVYAETSDEDAVLCLRVDEGRRALWRAGGDDAGPYQLPMETGVKHFHDYLRRELGRSV